MAVKGDTMETWSRRKFLKTAAATGSGLVLPGVVSALAKHPPLKLGYLPITDATSLLVAHGLAILPRKSLRLKDLLW